LAVVYAPAITLIKHASVDSNSICEIIIRTNVR